MRDSRSERLQQIAALRDRRAARGNRRNAEALAEALETGAGECDPKDTCCTEPISVAMRRVCEGIVGDSE